MKTGMYNEGACGIEQIIYLGTITHEAGTESTKLDNALPAGFKVTKFVIDVKEAFTASTTMNLGDKTTAAKYASAKNVAAAGPIFEDKFEDVGTAAVDVYAALSAEATDGSADIYAYVAKVEV